MYVQMMMVIHVMIVHKVKVTQYLLMVGIMMVMEPVMQVILMMIMMVH